jgi:co-chaperonin GroES (HSP10)
MLDKMRYLFNNSILIDTLDWSQNTSNLIQTYTRGNTIKRNYITKVLAYKCDEERYPYHNLEVDSHVLLNKRYNVNRKIELGGRIVSPLPFGAIDGVFRDPVFSIDVLDILDDRVLIEPIEDNYIGSIKLPESMTCSIGRVKKTGKGGFYSDWTRKEGPIVKEGDMVLYWKNGGTELRLRGRKYVCLIDQRVVGTFKDGIPELENLELLNGRILLKRYRPKVTKGGIIIPEDREDFEFSSIENNKFVVMDVSDTGVETKKGVFKYFNVNKNDMVIVDEESLELVDFKGEVLHTTSEVDSFEAVLTQETNK